MSSILLSGPSVEPVALDDAKAFLGVETDDDDERDRGADFVHPPFTGPFL